MPNNILITPGSASIQFSGSNANTVRLQVEPSGSVAFYGNSGSLFSIVDDLSGSLMSVNDVSGLPIFEVFSDSRVVMGAFNTNTLVVTGSRVGIDKANPQADLDVSGSVLITGSLRITSGFTGSFSGSGIISTSSFAQTASFALNAGGGGGGAGFPFSGSGVLTGSLFITGSGSNIFEVGGTVGTLFNVSDGLSGSLMNVNDISGLPILEVFSDDRVVMGTFGRNTLVVTGSRVGIDKANPQADLDISGSVFITGSLGITGIINATSSFAQTASFALNAGGGGSGAGFPFSGSGVLTGSLFITGSGSNVFEVGGTVGTLFNVSDGLSGSLMNVNDISGLPILEVFSDDRIIMGTFGRNTLVVTGSRVGIDKAVPTADLDISGSVFITGSLSISGSVQLPTGSVAISSGSITMPNRPAFRVTGTGGLSQAVTTLSGSMTTVDFNQGSHWNNTNGVFTAPIAGLYQINFVCRTYTNSGTAAQAVIVKNNTSGTNGTVLIMIEWAANTTMNHTGGSTIANLAVGDTLKAMVFLGQVSFDGNDNFSVAYIG